MQSTMARYGFRCGMLRAVLAASALTLTVIPNPVQAQSQARTFSFNIPSEPLSKALRDYGEATGQQIIFTEDLVAGRRAPALQGTFDADEALRRLLEGSDLVMERTPAGAIMIVRSDQAAKSAQASAQTADAAMLIEEIIVTATKREEPVRKISGSVTAFDQAGLDAVGAESFADYLKIGRAHV